MTTIYVIGSPGPWCCDDDLIRCDGIYAGMYIEGVAHVDGIGGVIDGGTGARRHKQQAKGLVRGSRHTGTVRGRDPL